MRCSYLDHDGKQCKRNAAALRSIHLDSEIYGFTHDPDLPDNIHDLATWVAVPLCKPHAMAFGGSDVKRGKVTDERHR